MLHLTFHSRKGRLHRRGTGSESTHQIVRVHQPHKITPTECRGSNPPAHTLKKPTHHTAKKEVSMAAQAQVHVQADATVKAKLMPKLLRKLFVPAVLVGAIHGSVKLDVGSSLLPSYAV